MTIDEGKLLALHREQFPLFAAQAFRFLNPTANFVPNNAFLAITHAMGEVAAGRTRRLVVTVPPRMAKSSIGSVALPAFLLGNNPSTKIVCASYSGDLAAILSRQTRALMEAPLYASLFPATTICKSTETEIETAHFGSRFATSVGGTLTGRGGNLIVIDDPMKPIDAASTKAREDVWEWFRSTVGSRLDDRSKDAMIVIMQRLHVDDLAGKLLDRGGWEHLNLPAIAEFEQEIPMGRGRVFVRKTGDLLDPVRLPKEELEQLHADMGSANFAAQYQQNPIPEAGGLVNWPWFQTYTGPAIRSGYDLVVMSWDTAMKSSQLSDYSVGIRAILKPKGELYIEDVIRTKLDYPALRDLVMQQARQSRGTVTLIEAAGSGIPLVQEMQQQGLTVIGIPPFGEKAMRFQRVTGRIEGKFVYLPAAAPWLANFKREILSFPNSTNDDQVDALSQLLEWSVGRHGFAPLQSRYSASPTHSGVRRFIIRT